MFGLGVIKNFKDSQVNAHNVVQNLHETGTHIHTDTIAFQESGMYNTYACVRAYNRHNVNEEFKFLGSRQQDAMADHTLPSPAC